MYHDFLNWLPKTVLFGVGGVVLTALVLSRLVEGRKYLADLFGPPGRWLHRRHEHNELLRSEERKRELREVLFDKDAPDYRALKRRTDALYKLVKTLEAEIVKLKIVEKINAANWDMTSAYLREDAHWHITAGVAIAEQGIELPEHRSYTKFCVDYRELHGGTHHSRRWDDEEEPDEDE